MCLVFTVGVFIDTTILSATLDKQTIWRPTIFLGLWLYLASLSIPLNKIHAGGHASIQTLKKAPRTPQSRRREYSVALSYKQPREIAWRTARARSTVGAISVNRVPLNVGQV